MRGWMSMSVWALAVAGAQAQGEYPFCQILDRVESPAWEAHGSYVLDVDVNDTGEELGLLGLSGGGGIGYYRTPVGDLDVTGDYDLYMLSGDGGLDLPGQLAALRLNAALTMRNAEGQALRLTLSPGIYSDLDEDLWKSLYLPFAVEGIQAFTPEVSGVLGVSCYPGFDQALEPRFGIRWSVNEYLLIDLMYPESRVTVFPTEGWSMFAGAKSVQTPEWNIDDDRGSVMLDELRGYIGVSHPLAEGFRLVYQAGLVVNREIDFDRHSPEYDMEDSMFLSVGVSGAL